MAQAMLAAAEPHYVRGDVTAYYMAHISGLNGDWRKAVNFLKEALAKHEDSVVDYSVDPAFKTVQTVPQFQAQMAQTTLPDIRQ
jgi:hypothetical protein